MLMNRHKKAVYCTCNKWGEGVTNTESLQHWELNNKWRAISKQIQQKSEV